MSIFTGSEVLFFFLGALFTLAAGGGVLIARKFALNWQAWTLGVLGTLLALFTVGWSVSSFLEGEPTAGVVGMLLFGFPALVLLILAYRVTPKSPLDVTQES